MKCLGSLLGIHLLLFVPVLLRAMPTMHHAVRGLPLSPEERNDERTVKRIPHAKKKSTCRRVTMLESRDAIRTRSEVVATPVAGLDDYMWHRFMFR